MPHPVTDPTTAPCLSVLSLNIWNYEGPWDARLPLIRALIAERKPDLIALQEVLQGPSIDQPELLFADTDYHVHYGPAQDFWLDQTLKFGNLIASRWPLSDVSCEPLPQRPGQPDRAAVAGTVASPHGPIAFVTSHLNYQPFDGAVREQQAVALASIARARAKRANATLPAIICGDFNATPDSAEVRYLKGLQSIAGDSTHFQDAWEAGGDGSLGLTFASTNPFVPEEFPDRRVDFIFVGTPAQGGVGLVEQCLRVGDIPDAAGIYPSDHFGLLAFVRAANGSPK